MKDARRIDRAADARKVESIRATNQVYQAAAPVAIPDFEEAQRFLTLLDEESENWTFQTFDDDKERSTEFRRKKERNPRTKVLHGAFDDFADDLSHLNAIGAGVFVTVNETDLHGRKEQNIIRVRAFFLDLDGAPLEPVLSAPLTPHIVVESSPRRYHGYWLVADCPLDQFTFVQKALIARFNSDASVHDLPRVMRLPGFWHLKGEPFQTRIIEDNPAPPYGFLQFKEAFGITDAPPNVYQEPPPITEGDDWRATVARIAAQAAERTQKHPEKGRHAQALWMGYELRRAGVSIEAAVYTARAYCRLVRKKDSDGKENEYSEERALEAIRNAYKEGANVNSQLNPEADIPLRKRFRVDEKGVWYRPPLDKEGKQPSDVWVCAPLHITAATSDHDRDNHGHLLEFRDRHGYPHQWAMPLELLEEKREYRRVLRRLGLTLNGSRDGNERLQQYLEVCHAMVKAICAGKIGWYESAYVLPDKTLNDTGEEQVFLQTLDANIEGYCQAGTLEDWKTHVAGQCIGNTRLLFGVSMGFAPPLLKWTDDESGGIHYRGSSSSGKTTVGYAARSVWGEQGGLESWRATINALEGVAEHHNDNLLTLDEIKQVDSREAGEVAYMLANGTGKRRGQKQGGTRKRLTWRLLFLSTGELSLEQHMQEAGIRSYAGQEVRLVDIPADAGQGHGVFENLHGHPDGEAFAKAIKASAGQYHGTAGRAFIQAFCEDIPGALKAINQLRETFIETCVPKDASGQVLRVASRIGLIGAAGELATRYGITGWPEGMAMEAAQVCLSAWIEARGGIGNAEIERALSQVRLFFERHGEARFTPWHDKEGYCERCNGSGYVDFTEYENSVCFDCEGTGKIEASGEQRRPPVSNRSGFRRATKDERTEYYVFSGVFKKEICSGLDVGFVTRLLIEHDLLMPDNNGKGTRKERLPGIGHQRVYRFTADILGGHDDGDA